MKKQKSVQMSLVLSCLQTKKEKWSYSPSSMYIVIKGEVIKKVSQKLHILSKVAGIKLRRSFFINGRSPHSVLP